MVCLPIWYLNTLKKNLKNSCLIGILLPYLGILIKQTIKVMKNALSTATSILVDHATNLFNDRRIDLPLTEYPDHYENLGLLIQQIDQYPSLGHIITDMENGELEVLGYFKDDDEAVMEFLKEVRDSM